MFELAGPGLDDIRISGTVKTGDLRLFLLTLEAGFTLDARILDRTMSEYIADDAEPRAASGRAGRRAATRQRMSPSLKPGRSSANRRSGLLQRAQGFLQSAYCHPGAVPVSSLNRSHLLPIRLNDIPGGRSRRKCDQDTAQ